MEKIVIYPFGGCTKYNELLSSSIKKEFIVLIGGPIFQLLFYFLILLLYKNGLVTEYNYEIVYNLHKYLLYFNLLPIIPLDGSKLFNLILESIFSYKLSNIILIIISYITIFIIVIYEKRLVIIFLSILLIKSIVLEIKNHNFKFNKFLLERYLYIFNYKEGRIINNIKKIKRNKTHKIIKNKKIYTEKEYLDTLYK